MNKVTLSIIVVILCIAIFTIAIISLSHNNSNNNTPMPTSTPSPTPSPTPNVKIINFTCLGIWGNSRLGSDLDLFSLSYTNLGMTDVENLTITLNTTRTDESDIDTLTIPYRYLDEYINGDIYYLESIKVNETKSFEKGYLIGLYNLVVEPFALTATLKSNDTILDQATIMIPISTAA